MTHSEAVVHNIPAGHSNQESSHTFFQVHEEIPSIKAPVLGMVGPFGIATSTITTSLIIGIVLLLSIVSMRAKMVPGKLQHIIELFYEAVVSFIASIVGNKEKALTIVPYVGSVLVYLLIANLLPMMPGVSGFTAIVSGEHVPLLRGATTDFSTTFGLALAVVLTIQFVGMKEQGVFGYFSHFVQLKQVYKGFRKNFGEGMVAIIGFFVGLIEIVSEFAKMLSLSLRLFGNLFAHEVLTVILLGAFAYGVPAIWMGMGFLVGVVQSIVFVALVTVYYSLVLKKDHGGH